MTIAMLMKQTIKSWKKKRIIIYMFDCCLIKNVIGVKNEKKMYGQSKYGVNTII